MSHLVLETSHAEIWHHYLGQLPEADIYFTPEYCQVYEVNGEGSARLFVFKEGNHLIIFPFLLRRINDLPLVKRLALGQDVYDIATPYGYGGPIHNITDPDECERVFLRFEEEFQLYAAQQGIIAEFVRFHPLLENHFAYQQVSPEFSRHTVYIDLTKSEADIERDYTRDARNRVRRAMKEGLTVEQGDPRQLEHLLNLYYKTMDKKQAASYYYFSETFFYNTVSFLKGNVDLLEVKYGEEVVASALFLKYGRFVHYHLMGSNQQYLAAAPVNLLIHHAAMHYKKQGYVKLHLGGGYTGDDNLLRFKRSFNQGEMGKFYIGRKIRHPDLYEAIIQQAIELPVDQSYFPLYRHPSLLLEPTLSHPAFPFVRIDHLEVTCLAKSTC